MQYLNISVRPMEDKDLPAVLELENLCFKAPWNANQLRYEMHENPVSNCWVIELEDANSNLKSICGFSIYWQTFDSATICQIAVHPQIQRHQLGSAMMDEIINDCRAKKVRTICLEVRESNAKAINFYKKHGFEQVVIKPHYYSNGENAIYMTREANA